MNPYAAFSQALPPVPLWLFVLLATIVVFKVANDVARSESTGRARVAEIVIGAALVAVSVALLGLVAQQVPV